MRLFHDRADYIAFLWLLAEAFDEFDVPVLAACVMPNHLHLVMRPRRDDDLAGWAHWLFTTHARRYHKKYLSSGRVWQGRFKASLAQADRHLLILLRYVERNALRASLVARAEDWEWGSLRWRKYGSGPIRIAPSPVPLPTTWIEYVNSPQTPEELAMLRTAIERQAPFGDEAWCLAKARELGLEQSLAPRGRPRKRIVTTK
jgi:putative transposase